MALADTEFNKLLEQAKAAYEALSPAEKWKHRREQAISFVYGQVRLSGTDISRSDVEQIVDQMIAEGKLKNALDGEKPVGKSVYELLMSDEEFL